MTPIRFDEDLELDRGAYELRRAGRRVRLERIPMEILLLLIDRRGELVTREEILENVWGPGVFVDPINSINGAIRKLRLALRDDPRNPRFIGTVTGKGYRFLAPLTEPPEESGPGVSVEASAAWRRPALVAIVLLAGMVVTYLARSHAAPTVPPRAGGPVMVAVLPFENLTGDRGQDYFSDGLTEEMITRLANRAPRDMGVIARTSVMRYRGLDTPLDTMGHELGVQYVLEGSVRRDGERLRVTAQLIRIGDQRHLWAREYDRSESDILAVQAEIAEAIAGRIVTSLEERRPVPPEASPLSPQEYEAYDRYLLGRHYLSRRTAEDLQRAISAFLESIAGNPSAQVYADLADAYALQGTYAFEPQAEVIPKAREAAEKALRLDETLSSAHTSLALISEFYDRDWEQAEVEFQQALKLDVNDVTAHHWYAELLGFEGRFEKALAQIEKARRLDPMSPIVAADQGAILYFAREYDSAIERFRFALAIDPATVRARMVNLAYVQQGRFDEALSGMQEWESTGYTPLLWSLSAYVKGRAGLSAEAERALSGLEASLPHYKGNPMPLLAFAYLGLNDRDNAIACLQKACEADPTTLVALKVDPIYDPLREDPRYQDLLSCARLSP